MKAFAVAVLAALCALVATPRAACADPLEQAFASYVAFQADVNAVSGAYSRSTEVEAALERLASYDSEELTRGFIAYAALAAAENRDFVVATNKAAEYHGPENVSRAFAAAGSTYAMDFNGADDARRQALAVARFDGERLTGLGQQLRQHALDLQAARWARHRATATRAARVARLSALSEPPGASLASAPLPQAPAAMATPAPMAIMDWTPAGPRPMSRALPTDLSTPKDQTEIVNAIMSLAALRALGRVERLPPADLQRLLTQQDLKGCFEMARLQLVQCVSTGEFWHENVACIGEAGLQTRGRCMSQIATAR